MEQVSLPPRGSRFGRFVVTSGRGQGRWGRVYEAYDPELDRIVAVSRMVESEGERAELLLAAARALANTNDPTLARVFEIGTEAGESFVVTELARGTTIEAW